MGESIFMSQVKTVVRAHRHGFTLNGTYLRGLVPTLQRHFYHDYKFTDAKRGLLLRPPVDRPPVGMESKGQERGKWVDREISKAIAIMASCNFKPAWVLSPKQYSMRWAKAKFKDPHDATWMANLGHNMHPFTRHFLALMKRRKWVAVGSQVTCGSKILRLGTAIDVIVRVDGDPKREHIVLEIKCGYYASIQRYSGKMHPPYQKLTNCPLNQFKLQLAWGRYMYKKMNARTNIGPAFVIVLHEYGSHVRKLTESVLCHEEDALRVLFSSRGETQKERKKAMKRVMKPATKKRKAPTLKKPVLKRIKR